MKRSYGELRRNRERTRRTASRLNMGESNKKRLNVDVYAYRWSDGNYGASVCLRGSTKRCGDAVNTTPTKALAEAFEHIAKRLKR